MELRISTADPRLAQSIREAGWADGLSVTEEPRDACLSEGYVEIFVFLVEVAKESIPILAMELFKILKKTKRKKITIGKTERVIPSEGEMYEILKDHYDADKADVKTGFA